MLRSRTPRPASRGFTLVELLVVIGIIAILIGILLPVLSKARKAAATAKCLANHKQLATAVVMYTNDYQGILPYCGAGDGYGSRRVTHYQGNLCWYSANWLYDPMQLKNGSTGPFDLDDIKTGALYPYFNAGPAVYWCPLADRSEPDPRYFQYLTSYCMNLNLCNGNLDAAQMGITSNQATYRLPHKINEFKPAQTVLFWDYPMTGAVGEGGQLWTNGSSKKDPSSQATDRPSVSARHTSYKNNTIATGDPNFIYTVQGVIPVSFLDGHAEAWPVYVFHDNLNPPGGKTDAALSALWVQPGDPVRGGAPGNTTYTMTDIFGSN